MKPQLTIAFLLLFISSALLGQNGIEFKVKILSDNTSFQVLARPNFTANGVAIAGSQVTLRVPLGGFEVGTITSHIGDWSSSPSYEDQASGYEYFFFAPAGPMTGNNMQEDVEIPLFTFVNNGSCTGPMELFDNDNDPLANSQSVNFVNSMTLIGGGFSGQDAYLGNYNAISADCADGYLCEDDINTIDIIDIILTSPSQCGATDGSIEIVAVASQTALPLQYSINGFNNATWQTNDPVFDNLAAGDIFEIWVRHLGGFCLFHVGDFELDAPLAAVIQDISDTSPDCGMSNGTITITAISNSNGPLEYGVGTPPVYQDSPTIENLPAGIHPLWVRDPIANCESLIASYLLQDCQNVPCSNLDLEYMGSGIYQVSLTSGETINQPNDVTETMNITLKVPTGGFQVSNLTSQVTDVDFNVGSTTVAPATSPDFDYVTIELGTPNTQDIPYFANTKIPLFTFENGGTCPGDSVYLIQMDDPYLQSGADINHEISVSGVMLNDCIGEGAVECGVVPSMCDVTCEIDRLPTGEFRISVMTDNVSLSGPQAITSGMLVTLKVPTGGFQVSNLTPLINSNFQSNLIVANPAEDPGFDYYGISQTNSTAFNNSPDYMAGQMIPFLTFENVGPCVSGDVILVDNDDPVAQAVAAGNNVTLGQTITILGVGPTIPMCLSSNASVECMGDPCATLVAGFTVGQACSGQDIAFTNTTTSNETISSWEWNFGDGSPTSDLESPSHNFSNSGNFEVSLTVTTNSGCEAIYSEFVTVFSSPEAPTQTDFVDCGTGVEITVPSAASIMWSPEDGLLPSPPTDQATVTAHPNATTVYTVTLTSADGCVTTADLNVVVDVKPDWKDATSTPVSDCGLADGQVAVTATHANNGVVEYSMDANGPWTTDNIFTGLAPGDYNFFARNQDTGCTVASPFNPVTITGPNPLSIDNVEVTDPTGSNDNGSITVTASGGDGALQYTLVGVAGPQDSNIFTGLGDGTYTLEVSNADGSCVETQQVTLTAQVINVNIVSSIFDDEICESAMGSVEITLDADIQNANITGGTFSNEVINGPTITFDVDPVLGANNYSVEINTTNGGNITVPVNITGTAVPTADFTTSPTLCTGGQITLNFSGTASNNATFQWNLDGGTVDNDFGNGTIIAIYGTEGTFNPTVTVDDNGCQAMGSNPLSVTAFDPNASLAPTQPSCSVGNDGAIDLEHNAGSYSYNWSGPDIAGATATQQDQSGLSGGTYLVTITDDNSQCSTVESIVLDIPTGISIAAVPSDATSCAGASGDGTITVNVSGGNGNFTYELRDIDDNILESNTNSASSFVFENLTADAYQVAVTDASGCTDVETVAVNSINGGVETTSDANNSDCATPNGSVSIAITAGSAPYSYQYYLNNDLQNEGDVTGTTLDIGGIAPGNVVIVITDASGCDDVVSYTITENDPNWLTGIVANVTEPVCGGDNGVIELQNVPPTAFVNWECCPTVLGTTLTDVSAGNYKYTVLDVDGCEGSSSVTVNSTDGPEVEIVQTNPADCGESNGGVVFQVNSSNNFSYRIIGNGVVEGTGSPNTPITTTGLGAGPFTIEVEDLTIADCKGFESAEIDGELSAIGEVNTYTTLPSECGVADAEIEIEVETTNMLNIASDKGTVPANFTSTVTITDLYDGDVNITLTDPLTGCSRDIIIELEEQAEPEISNADFTLTSPTCPDDMGSFVLNVDSDDYTLNTPNGPAIIPSFNDMVDVESGTYTVYLVNGQCVDSMSFEVAGPAVWDVQATIIPEGCDFQDGSIELLVSGGTGSYTFNWDNNISDTSIAEGLSTGDYAVTVTDSLGCEYEIIEFVSNDLVGCDNPCEDFIFFTDTVYVALSGDANKICLPTELTVPEFETFNLNLDGTPFNVANLDECGEKAAFYAYSSLVAFAPPYRVEEWETPDHDLPVTEFNTIQELVDLMNTTDPTGNWIIDENQMIIIGGDPASEYNSLVITHIATNSTLSLEPNTSIIVSPSITVNDDRTHVLIATDPFNADCADTLYINLLTDGPPTPDTMYVEVEIGAVQDTCLDASELNGVLESLQNECTSLENNAQWLAAGDECIQIEGLQEGSDEFCFVLCNDNGVCDTTYVIVDVTDPSTEILVFTAVSPNGDGKNDNFKIKNIEHYPNNKLTIFNRWGNMVYRKKGYTNDDPWKAIYKNTLLTDGTYFYILEVEIDGVMERMTGYIQVHR